MFKGCRTINFKKKFLVMFLMSIDTYRCSDCGNEQYSVDDSAPDSCHGCNSTSGLVKQNIGSLEDLFSGRIHVGSTVLCANVDVSCVRRDLPSGDSVAGIALDANL